MPKIIAIDGPAGAGKSTVARQVAQRLGWRFLDSGALYRALSLAALEHGLQPTDGHHVAALGAQLDLRQGPDGRTYLGARDVSSAIRTEAVTAFASRASAQPEVRAALLGLQRAAARDADLVCEGRDMGSVVFPDAALKIFLDAQPQVRAGRRTLELAGQGGSVDAKAVQQDMEQRDHADSSRAVAPLQCAADQQPLDTTGMTVDEVVNRILELFAERLREGVARR